MEKTEKKWNIIGICLIASDSIYKKLQKAIEDDNLDIPYLQKITGHLAPISVDRKRKTITFSPF